MTHSQEELDFFNSIHKETQELESLQEEIKDLRYKEQLLKDSLLTKFSKAIESCGWLEGTEWRLDKSTNFLICKSSRFNTTQFEKINKIFADSYHCSLPIGSASLGFDDGEVTLFARGSELEEIAKRYRISVDLSYLKEVRDRNMKDAESLSSVIKRFEEAMGAK